MDTESWLARARARESVWRAFAYAHRRGVLSVAAAGNDSTDLARKTTDTLSPNEAASFWRSRGVAAVASTAFATNPVPPRAVRLCLGGPTTQAQCEQSLRVVADVLRHPQQVHASVM